MFAAASLKTALDEIVTGYEAQSGDTVTVSYAGSSAMARQISYGAPADLFISANVAWMDSVEEQSLIRRETRVDLLANTLVLIAPNGAYPVSLDASLPDGRIAMALVDAVPAGIYGKAALTSLNLWDDAAPNVVQADNVRAALALVALGEAALGITYGSDAMAEPRVSIVATFPEGSHPPIRYPAALLTDASPSAADFLAYLQGDAARAIFTAQGFTPLVE